MGGSDKNNNFERVKYLLVFWLGLLLPSYLTKALVYYIKGRLAEDAGEVDLKEYMMREYKKHIETYESSLMKGPRIISSGFHAIR